jgi:hypothetical protein
MKRFLPFLAAALVLLRPVCDVLAANEPGVDVAAKAHATTCENSRGANSNESAPCCASVDKDVVAKVSEPGAVRASMSAPALPLASARNPARYASAAAASIHGRPGAPPTLSFYARSTRILR